jgi:hypothetical protein
MLSMQSLHARAREWELDENAVNVGIVVQLLDARQRLLIGVAGRRRDTERMPTFSQALLLRTYTAEAGSLPPERRPDPVDAEHAALGARSRCNLGANPVGNRFSRSSAPMA